jgi:hypothetical protein
MMAVMFSRAASLATSLVLLASCAPAATQIVVVVDSDLEPGSELAAVEASASVGGRAAETHRFDLAAGEVTLPFSFGIVAPAGGADDVVRVTLDALDPEGRPLVGWHASTHFRAHATLRLDAPLARACGERGPCEESGLACERGECRADAIDAASLVEIDPSAPPPRLFEGPSAAPDAGAADDACVEGAPCDTGDPCTAGALRCGDGACVPGAPMPAGAECGDGRTCDGEGRCGTRTPA